MASIEDLLDNYLSGNTGKLIDPSQTAASGPDSRDGKVVELTGEAEIAAMGAVVVDAEGRATYVAGLESWPSDLYRKQVSVKGTWGRSVLPSDALMAADGSASHGAYGSSQVLFDATWKLAE